jgi:mRNA-degrading endonuclease RelE of RelBE toxin-antitoxin system
MSETWTWALSERAATGLESLDADTQQRVLDKFDDVVSDEFRDPPEFAKPLTGMGPWQSLRIGDYRAIVRFGRDEQVVQVGAVGHRSSIYDEFPYGYSPSKSVRVGHSPIARHYATTDQIPAIIAIRVSTTVDHTIRSSGTESDELDEIKTS